MFRISGIRQKKEGGTFDFDYYLNKHPPMSIAYFYGLLTPTLTKPHLDFFADCSIIPAIANFNVRMKRHDEEGILNASAIVPTGM